jgi:large subunit ribosomal protein L17
VGDNAELALIELVDYNDVYGKGTTAPAEATGKRTRRGRGKRGAEGTEAAGTSTAVPATPAPEATTAAELPPATDANADEAVIDNNTEDKKAG